MEKDRIINEVTQAKYREILLKRLKEYRRDNPDRLTEEEFCGLEMEAFEHLAPIEIMMGVKDRFIPKRANVSKNLRKSLMMDFLDWYEILGMYSHTVLEQVKRYFPVEQYHRILCVGDGEKCHLGRKLAKLGYDVISMDPLAKYRIENVDDLRNNGGSFKISTDFFSHEHPIISSSDLIVGSKVPSVCEEMLLSGKPTVFTISANPEIYDMEFSGVSITSHDQLVALIQEKYPNVMLSRYPMSDIFTQNNGYIVFEQSPRTIHKNQEGKTSAIGQEKTSDNKTNPQTPVIDGSLLDLNTYLKNLSSDKIQVLETYLYSRSQSGNIRSFLNDLKSGKLRNKAVDIDMLDFVEEGLSDLVREGLSYIQNKSQVTIKSDIGISSNNKSLENK